MSGAPKPFDAKVVYFQTRQYLSNRQTQPTSSATETRSACAPPRAPYARLQDEFGTRNAVKSRRFFSHLPLYNKYLT